MDNNTQFEPDGLIKVPFNFGMRGLFYAVTPSETSFKNPEDVPNYITISFPFFYILIVLEIVVAHLKGMDKPRLNDSYSSFSAGIISQMPLLLVSHMEVLSYVFVFNHFNIVTLPWDRASTWWIALLVTDFGYYLAHRYAHEINFMWAAHQVHHSSEDYNYITSLRQSIFQQYCTWIFYLPMALFVPPSVFMVHKQFNLLFQFWIHTEVIRSVGPLEYILNTPSHHRVHHGRNRYCIDKNYAGVFIIWDRLFGTFAAEDEKVVYGLVHPINSWNPIYIQLCHWKYMLETFWTLDGTRNKIAFFFNGPGWAPGKPRMGNIEDIPEIDAKNPEPKYDSSVPLWLNLYVWFHFITVVLAQTELGFKKELFSPVSILMVIAFMMWTLTNFGYFYENKHFAAPLEALRCLVYIAVDAYICGIYECPAVMSWMRVVYILSFMLWGTRSAGLLGSKTQKVE